MSEKRKQSGSKRGRYSDAGNASSRGNSRRTKPTRRKPSGLPPVEAAGEFRLQKFLASAGLGSRRQCEELIRTGRITVDGMPVDHPGINIDPKKQTVEYDGENLKPQKLKYFVLNKPKGVLCTNHDPGGRTRVIDLFEREKVRLFPVGRLDEESEGLLIVTNDGDFGNQLAHPRYRIYRTYRIQVAGFPSAEALKSLREGIYFREGKFKVISVRRAGKLGKSSFLEVVLGEGHNREVRRLFAKIGHKVMSLERLKFGPLNLGKLKRGMYREMTAEELEQFREILTRNRETPLQKKEQTAPKQSRSTAVKKKITRKSRAKQVQKKSEGKKAPKTYVFR